MSTTDYPQGTQALSPKEIRAVTSRLSFAQLLYLE